MSRSDRGLRRLAAGTLLVAFPGTTAPAWVLRELELGLGGVTLFGFNVADAEQLTSLTAELRGAAGEPVISLDEEGGDVTRLAYHVGSPYPGNAALGAVDDVELTRQVYRAIGSELAACGINLDMAPDADVNSEADNPVIGTRAFGNEAALVSRHTVAAVQGLQSVRVAACVKHFPGHGATRVDSHLSVPVVDVTPELLRTRELAPFRAAIEAGTKSIMTAHVAVPFLTGDTPATLSPAALTELLRGELGYDGVVVSDALDMQAIVDSVGLAGGSALSLAAGTDLLCLGPLPTYDDVREVIDGIVAAVGDGRLPLSRLEQAADRVDALRAWFGSGFDSRFDSQAELTGQNGIGLHAARRAVRLTGAPAPLVEPLVIEVDTPPTIAVGDVPWGVGPWLPEAEILRVEPAAGDVPGLLAKAAGRSLVVVVKDAHRNAGSRELVSALVAARPDLTVIEMGLPIWRPAGVTHIATYGAARPNAQAAAELIRR
ncbi:glycoside hydrolase family 3 protein [Nonomuraea sp. ZG12]|uniref:glycoside hydrolase family 3 protein n=1 Tax=Nonomuraea sp. ZG12 TaxID=3452207 RepID=UPI003F88CF73